MRSTERLINRLISEGYLEPGHYKYVGDSFEEISLDHDLGGDDTGFKVLDWIISWGAWPKVFTIHTANPPARKRMLAAVHHEAPEWTDIYVITDHLKGNEND